MSRPNSSVPKGCASRGPSRRSGTLSATGSYGARSGAARAPSTTIRISAAPTPVIRRRRTILHRSPAAPGRAGETAGENRAPWAIGRSVLHPRVHEEVEEVHPEVDQDVDRPHHQDDALDHGVVPPQDRRDDQLPDAGKAEHRLG